MLLHLIGQTCSNITYAVNSAARYMPSITVSHLKVTSDEGLKM